MSAPTSPDGCTPDPDADVCNVDTCDRAAEVAHHPRWNDRGPIVVAWSCDEHVATVAAVAERGAA